MVDGGLTPALLLAIFGVLAAGWGASRSGAVAGWKSVAEARKERLAEVDAALVRAEDQIVTLNRRVAELEALPDLREVRDEVRLRHDQVLERLDAVRGVVDEIAARWG